MVCDFIHFSYSFLQNFRAVIVISSSIGFPWRYFLSESFIFEETKEWSISYSTWTPFFSYENGFFQIKSLRWLCHKKRRTKQLRQKSRTKCLDFFHHINLQVSIDFMNSSISEKLIILYNKYYTFKNSFLVDLNRTNSPISFSNRPCYFVWTLINGKQLTNLINSFSFMTIFVNYLRNHENSIENAVPNAEIIFWTVIQTENQLSNPIKNTSNKSICAKFIDTNDENTEKLILFSDFLWCF